MFSALLGSQLGLYDIGVDFDIYIVFKMIDNEYIIMLKKTNTFIPLILITLLIKV